MAKVKKLVFLAFTLLIFSKFDSYEADAFEVFVYCKVVIDYGAYFQMGLVWNLKTFSLQDLVLMTILD